MKTTIKNRALRIKNHVKNHRVAYAVGTTLALSAVVNVRRTTAFYEFLESKSIDPMEFYCPEWYQELNP